MPVMAIVTVADPLVNATALEADNSIRVPDDICAAVGVTVVKLVEATLGVDPIVNTPDGNVILTLSLAANAVEIFIVIVKVPVGEGATGFVHTAELPWEERAPPEDAHSPFAASHVVPTSQQPGP